MRRSQTLASLALTALTLAGCSRYGTGAAVRADVTARMQSVQAPIAACYAEALQRDRKLRGMMIVQFRAAPDTGQFDQLVIGRDEVGDAAVRQCVLAQVGGLKLATPQRTAIALSYPLRFAPTK
jgi:hypothetical protein